MKWTHLICFFLISLAEYISRDDLDAHYQVFFNITSVLTYQTTIIGVWLYQHCIPDKLSSRDEELPEVRNCIVDENFGDGREWLVYESMAYFVQLFQLLIILVCSEFYDKNINKYEQQQFSDELRKSMMDKIKGNNIAHIIFIDDKNEKAMNKLENQLVKEVSLA
jgi:hypothetical protein